MEINTSSAILEMDGKRFVVCFSMNAPRKQVDDEDDQGDEDDEDNEDDDENNKDDDQARQPKAGNQPTARANLELSLVSVQTV